MIVLHYTDMADADAALAWLVSPESRGSAHYLVTMDGETIAMVDEAARAWHAGAAYWDGTRDVNGRSIGIELDSPGHRPDAPSFPATQIDALLDLVASIRDRWTIPARNVVAHSDVAPMRKRDPGEAFPWARLAAAGHALFVPVPSRPATLSAAALHAALSRAGYGLPATPREAEALVRAVHRRHRPDAVDQPADGITAALAEALADAAQADRAAHPAAATAPRS